MIAMVAPAVRPRSKAPLAAAGTIALALLSGCSSMGGSAIRTGPVKLPAYAGPVAVYPLSEPPAGGVDLGVVEVHASQQEATVDALLPQFVKRVAEIGGDAAVIEGVRARFAILPRTQVETFYYTCGLGATCAGTRVYAANDEVMTVTMFGHAYSTRQSQDLPPSAPLMPKDEEPPMPPNDGTPDDPGDANGLPRSSGDI